MLDSNFRDPGQQQRLSQQRIEAIKLLMNETLSKPDTENINKLKDLMGVPSESVEYKTNE